MGGGELGGGLGRSNVKNQKTYIGQDAGRAPGLLDQFMGMYMQNAQRNQALSDQLLGGKGYGASSLFRGNGAPPPAGAGGGAGAPATAGGATASSTGGVQAPGPGAQNAMVGGGGGDQQKPPEGDGGQGQWNSDNDPDGSKRQAEFVKNNPQTIGQGDEGGPNGGLIGSYQDIQNNPWQTQGGDAETDNLGQYDWMASGQRNADESNVYGGEGDIGKQYDQFGQSNATDAMRKAGYGGMSDTGANQWEGASGGTYGDIAGGPNAAESSLYGKTGGYGSTAGEGEQGAMDIYKNEAAKPGYDDATKAAMTQEAMGTARSPFERARDRIVRANTARGNPASSMGAEIALARDEGDSIGSAGRKNLIDQSQEAIRQRQEAAQGMQGVQNLANQRQQFGITSQAGQNAQQAQQRLAGAAGLGATGRDIQSRVATGLEGMGAAQAAQDARKQAGLTGQQGVLSQQAAQNQQQRDTALKGTQGKQSMFDTMAARKAAAAQALTGIQQGAAGQFQTSQAGGGNLGGKVQQDYTEAGNASGGI